MPRKYPDWAFVVEKEAKLVRMATTRIAANFAMASWCMDCISVHGIDGHVVMQWVELIHPKASGGFGIHLKNDPMHPRCHHGRHITGVDGFTGGVECLCGPDSDRSWDRVEAPMKAPEREESPRTSNLHRGFVLVFPSPVAAEVNVEIPVGKVIAIDERNPDLIAALRPVEKIGRASISQLTVDRVIHEQQGNIAFRIRLNAAGEMIPIEPVLIGVPRIDKLL